jgi:hypothetical protein
MFRELTAEEVEFVAGGRAEVAAPSIRQLNVSNVDITANTLSGLAGSGSDVGAANEVTVSQSNGVG